MATRRFCDRCGKEITRTDSYINLTLEKMTNPNKVTLLCNQDRELEICNNCASELTDFLISVVQ